MISMKKIFFVLIIFIFSFNFISATDNFKNSISILSEIPEISSIDVELNNSESFLDTSKNISFIPILYENPYDLSGNEIKILQYEKGVPVNHTDFSNRMYVENLFPDIIEHATLVAGIMIGNGTINSSYVGVAPKSMIYAYQEDFLPYGYSYDLEDNYESGINSFNVGLITNSYGHGQCNLLGEYNSFTQLIDSFVFGNYTSRTVPIVWAVGNSQGCNSTSGYYTIAPEASAKNIISVGDIYDNGYIDELSGFGPTNNNRIKPDLVAPGNNIWATNLSNSYSSDSGTSFSAPHVSGTIALMLEQWNKSGYQSSIGDPLPSTIKALLLDSTTDLSSSGNGTQIIDGPDYKNGFGLLNAKGAVDRIINGTFKEANLSEVNPVNLYSLNITNQNSIKVTLAWDDVPNANLVNDLDLKLISPKGKVFYPWTLDPNNPSYLAVRNQTDNLNVVERVYINETEITEEGNGEWLVIVSSSDLPYEQKYSIVSENQISTNIYS